MFGTITIKKQNTSHLISECQIAKSEELHRLSNDALFVNSGLSKVIMWVFY